jgi:hypothetical protein
LLQISVDDIIDFKNDDDFANNVERNTMRYVHLFEEVADLLLPESLVQHTEDIYDILKAQRRIAVLQAAEAQDGAPGENMNVL